MVWKEKQEQAKDILQDLYRLGFVETIFNTLDSKHYDGWILKNRSWSPWYLNLRPIGSEPRLLNQIGHSMNLMLQEEVPDLDQIVGVEMAGIPIATISGASDQGQRFIPFAYTRPLPEGKVRTLEKAREALARLEEENKYDEWGGHQLVEGRLTNNQNLCIVDDMVTDLGSKSIAKEIIFYEVRRLGLKDITCDEIAVVLDREQGAEEAAEKNNMKLHSLIKFRTDGLDWLKEVMHPEEYELINKFQNSPETYQTKEAQQKAIEMGAKYRR